MPLRSYRGEIDRSTIVRTAPVDSQGNEKLDLAVDTTAGVVCLRKTSELVYEYIKSATEEQKETYVVHSARTMNDLPPSSLGAPTEFASHTWGDHFCDTGTGLLLVTVPAWLYIQGTAKNAERPPLTSIDPPAPPLFPSSCTQPTPSCRPTWPKRS